MDAMQRLDLVVFVPVEALDRVGSAPSDHRRLRLLVHEALGDILLRDRWGFGVRSLEVWGTPEQRVRQVLEWVSTEDRP